MRLLCYRPRWRRRLRTFQCSLWHDWQERSWRDSCRSRQWNQDLVNGYEGPGSYARDIHYIAAYLTSDAVHNYLLFMTSLLIVSSLSSTNIIALPYCGWGTQMDGGTQMTTFKWACGGTNARADSGRGCNCDTNDDVWREDSRLLTEKSHLPVLQLRFGDTGSSQEYGYHTLGKLKCYGIF